MKTVLVIDDEKQNIDLAVKVLKKNDYKVLEAYSVRDGMDILTNIKVDVVLMDIMMPNIDGVSGVRWMKSDRILKKIPIIMMTALSDKNDVVNAFNAGADDYLVKPYNIEHLVQKVKTLDKIVDFVDKWCGQY